jgi:hypothetical protein
MKETLEEVLKLLHDKWNLTDSLTTTGKRLVADTINALSIIEQEQERMYSEEDMKLAYKTGARLALISQSDLALCKGKFPTPDEWFNEFKKQ